MGYLFENGIIRSKRGYPGKKWGYPFRKKELPSEGRGYFLERKLERGEKYFTEVPGTANGLYAVFR